MSDRGGKVPCAAFVDDLGVCVRCGFAASAHTGSGGARGVRDGEAAPGEVRSATAPEAAPAPSPPLSADGERRVEEVLDRAAGFADAKHATLEGDSPIPSTQEAMNSLRAAVRGLVAEREQAQRDRDETERAWRQDILDLREAEVERDESDAQFRRTALERDRAQAKVKALLAALRDCGIHAASCPCSRHLYCSWHDADNKSCTCALRVLAEEEGSR